MKSNLPKRMICALCAICLMLTSAFASEEPDASEEPQVLEAIVTEKETPEDGDPMAARMELRLDGGTKTFSDFTPRALNNEILRRGIDVSAWQGSIDWEKADALWGKMGKAVPVTLEMNRIEDVRETISFLKKNGYFGYGRTDAV